MQPCKHGHVDGVRHIPCPKCQLEARDEEIAQLRAQLAAAPQAAEAQSGEFPDWLSHAVEVAADAKYSNEYVGNLFRATLAANTADPGSSPPAEAAPAGAMPNVCCGEFATCQRACVPRGRWQVEQEMAAKPPAEAALRSIDLRPLLYELAQAMSWDCDENWHGDLRGRVEAALAATALPAPARSAFAKRAGGEKEGGT